MQLGLEKEWQQQCQIDWREKNERQVEKVFLEEYSKEQVLFDLSYTYLLDLLSSRAPLRMQVYDETVS